MPAGSFSQTISLEGADDVRAKLQAIGATGEKAFGQLKQAVGATNLRNVASQFEGVKTSATNMASGLAEAANSIGSFGGAALLLLGRLGPFGLAIGAAGAAMAAFARSSVDAVTAQSRTAAALGFTLEQFKGLSLAARQAGIDQDTLIAGLRRFSQAAAAEAADQFKGLVDTAKLLPRILDNITRAQSQNLGGRPSFNSAELQKLQAAAGRVAQQIQSKFDEIDLGRLTNVSQFKEELVRLASSATEAGRAVRDAMRTAGADVPALTPLEKLDELVRRNAADFKSLGISFLDANGNIIETNEALLKTLDTLSKLPEGIQRTNALQKAFGREGAVEFGKLIAAGNTNNIRAAQAAMDATREANRKLAEEAAAAAVKFRELDAAFTKFRNSAGVPLASGLIEGLNLISDAIDALKRKANDNDVLGNFLKGISGGTGNILREFVNLGAFIQARIDAIKAAWQDLKLFFSGQPLIPNLPTVTWDQWLQSLIQRAQTAWEQIKQIFAPSPLPTNLPTASWDEWLQSLIDKAQAAWDTIKKIFEQALPKPGSDTQPGSETGIGENTGFARGGFTGWIGRRRIAGVVHGGEHVQPAHVVARPGVLAFLETLRHTGDLTKTVSRFVRGFDMGGLVDGLSRSLAVPNFANGGAVAALPAGGGFGDLADFGRVEIGDGGRSFRVIAHRDVVDQLKRSSRDSAGRKPSWFD